jgi:hypothetical protein
MDKAPDAVIREMRVMDKTGDTKIVWSSANPDEVENARRTFNDLIKKGYSAFAVKREGEKGKKITEFDPDLEAMIITMVKPISAG